MYTYMQCILILCMQTSIKAGMDLCEFVKLLFAPYWSYSVLHPFFTGARDTFVSTSRRCELKTCTLVILSVLFNVIR